MGRGPTFQNIQSNQVMNRVTAPSMPFAWSLNPYRGCTHGCSFCYARNTHTYMGLSADDSFRQNIFIKEDAARVLDEQLAHKLRRYGGDYHRLQQAVGLLAIGTATDPYQPIEARKHVTRSCLEVLAHYGISTSITTRSPLILRDIDILSRMNLHSINISVNTLEKTVWRNLEPATPAPIKRLETVAALTSAGLTAGVFLAPIVPLLTDSHAVLSHLLETVKEHHAQYVMPSMLRLMPDVKAWYLSVLTTHYPSILPEYKKMYATGYPPKNYVKTVMDTVHRLMSTHKLQPYDHISPTPPSPSPSPSRRAAAGQASDSIQLVLPI